MRVFQFALPALAAIILTACGGGGSNGATPALTNSTTANDHVMHAADIPTSTSPAICATTPSPAPDRNEPKTCSEIPSVNIEYPYPYDQDFDIRFEPDEPNGMYLANYASHNIALYNHASGTLIINRRPENRGYNQQLRLTVFDPGAQSIEIAPFGREDSTFTDTSCTTRYNFGDKFGWAKIRVRMNFVDNGPGKSQGGAVVIWDERRNIGVVRFYALGPTFDSARFYGPDPGPPQPGFYAPYPDPVSDPPGA